VYPASAVESACSSKSSDSRWWNWRNPWRLVTARGAPCGLYQLAQEKLKDSFFLKLADE
jgi:hypothetical protein